MEVTPVGDIIRAGLTTDVLTVGLATIVCGLIIGACLVLRDKYREH